MGFTVIILYFLGMNQKLRSSSTFVSSLVVLSGCFAEKATAIDIVVDYSFDTENFFDTTEKRDAIEAAAARYSAIINSDLAAVAPSGTASGTNAGWRVGFTHPGTGQQNFQLSTAADSGSDSLVGAGAPLAGEYGFVGLNANEWLLFAGGRSLNSDGVGGTGTGTNFTSTFNDIEGPMHRGFDDNTPSATSNDLPRWGGSISFDTGTNWHFGIDTASATGESDFYSLALHEVGHALGLSISFNQWQNDGSGNYLGLGAIDAYNLDNGTSLTSLELASATNDHWADGLYQSEIFELGNPNLVGTVGLGVGQDLIMEPIANFTRGSADLS